MTSNVPIGASSSQGSGDWENVIAATINAPTRSSIQNTPIGQYPTTVSDPHQFVPPEPAAAAQPAQVNTVSNMAGVAETPTSQQQPVPALGTAPMMHQAAGSNAVA